jgi:asparagine synthase (glutamine-hydrolysing)
LIFTSIGANELCGEYPFIKKNPDPIEFDKETRRLLKDLHLNELLVTNKINSCEELEIYMPFLDKEFVNNYISIPAFIRSNEFFKDKGINIIEKYLLRASFSSLACRILEKQILPHEILWK